VANVTAIVAMPSTAALSPDNGALIGGIVGGIVALLLVGGLIAFLVARTRRRRGEPQPSIDAPLTPQASVGESKSNTDVDDKTGAALHRSNYESLALSPPPESNYGAVGVKQSNNANYSTPVSNRNDYEFGDIMKVR
jgi:hypothetical protein